MQIITITIRFANWHMTKLSKGDPKSPSQINDFLDKVQLPKLNITEINECVLSSCPARAHRKVNSLKKSSFCSL